MAVLTRLLVVAVLLAIPVATRAQRPQPTFLAVVDAQGRLTPIAVYDGATWWNCWPWAAESEEVRNLPVPRSLAAIPADWLPPGVRLPVNWQAFTSGKLVPFRALRPTRSPEEALVTTVAIGTTYRGRPEEENTLAISGPGVLGSFVDLSGVELDPILRQLESRIATIEADEIARWRKETIAEGAKDIALTRTYMVTGSSGTRHVSTPPQGEEQDYGVQKDPTPIEGRTYQYLHSEKLFKLRPDAECMMNLSTQGLIVVDQAGRVESEKIAATAFSEYCGDAGEFVDHLATITVGRRTWWVVKISLEDGSDYGLIDPRTGAPVELKVPWEPRPKNEMPNPNRGSAFGIRDSALIDVR